MQLRALIVDDEPLARTLVRNFLSTDNDITIVGECADGFEALKAIQEQNLDLVFLDIQMPKITGLELLELLEKPPVIVFTTAYDQHAIKAFEMNAIDYLLKPFSKDRFAKALEKAKAACTNKKSFDEKIENLKTNEAISVEKIDRIVVKDGHKIQLIPCDSVLYLEAQDDYVMIYTQGHKYLKQHTMKHFEQVLPKDFARVHRSYIVNIKQVQRLENYDKDSHRIILTNGSAVPVSRSGYAELKSVLGL